MPGPKRTRRERTDEWADIKQWTLWPEQELYEQIRPKSRPERNRSASHLVAYSQVLADPLFHRWDYPIPETMTRKLYSYIEGKAFSSIFNATTRNFSRETPQNVPD